MRWSPMSTTRPDGGGTGRVEQRRTVGAVTCISVSDRTRGVLAGVAAYSLWGLFPLYFPYLEPAGAVEILAHRIAWSFLVVTVLVALSSGWGQVRSAWTDRGRRWRLALAAGVIAVNWLGYIWAVNNDHVVDAALGYFVNPLVTVVLGVAILGERLSRLQWLAVSAGGTAVVVLTVAYGRLPWISLVLAASFATYGFLQKTVGVDAIPALWVETAVLLPATLVGMGALQAAGELTFASEGPGHAVWLASAGIVTATPLLLFAAAAHRIPLTLVGLLQYLTPVGQFLVGVVVKHEEVPPTRLAGFVLVWLALALLTVDVFARTRVTRLAGHRAATSPQ